MKQGIQDRGNSGFTLIELLMVVAIIGILAAIVLAITGAANRKAAKAAAQAGIEKISNSLEEYRLIVGTYPTNLTEITTSTALAPEYKNIPATDPWNRAYQYKRGSRFTYELYSQGPSTTITTDDIKGGSY